MLTPSIRRSIRFDASLKSHPYAGTRSGPTTSTDIKVAAIDAVSPEVAERFLLDAPLQTKQTFAYTSTVIKPGMYLEYGGRQYNVKGLATYPEGEYTFYHLILEEIVNR